MLAKPNDIFEGGGGMTEEEVEFSVRPLFEAYYERTMCGHLSDELRQRTLAGMLRRSQVEGYGHAYFHSQTHYLWIGFRNGYLLAKGEVVG